MIMYGIVVSKLLEDLLQTVLATIRADELDGRTDEIFVRRDKIEALDLGLHNDSARCSPRTSVW